MPFNKHDDEKHDQKHDEKHDPRTGQHTPTPAKTPDAPEAPTGPTGPGITEPDPEHPEKGYRPIPGAKPTPPEPKK